MGAKKKGLFVSIGGAPFDLTAGMIEAVTSPPAGFVSKHKFVETDVAARLQAIDWFASCGDLLSLELTMETQQLRSWSQEVASCQKG